MRRIIFAKTHWNYQSYTDFWRLVELSGFPICYVDEIDMSCDATYIVAPMNGEVHDKFAGANLADKNAKLLLWNIERPGGSGGVDNYVMNNIKLENYFYRVLVSDRMLAIHCDNMIGSDYFVYTPLGLHEGLGTPGSFEDKKYDLIHLSCYSYRRARLFRDPSNPYNEYLGCSVATNGWGEKRHQLLQQSRFMYATHQDEHAYIEPLRYTLAIAYGLPIIAERSYDVYPYGAVCAELDSSLLHGFVKLYNKDTYNYALSIRDKMLQDFQFKDCIEKTVQGLGI